MIDNVFASLALVAITVGSGPVFDDLKFANSFDDLLFAGFSGKITLWFCTVISNILKSSIAEI